MIEKSEFHRKQEFKRLMDKNGDGLADRSELLSYVSPKHPRHSLQEAAALFNIADRNKDKRLSFQEVRVDLMTFSVCVYLTSLENAILLEKKSFRLIKMSHFPGKRIFGSWKWVISFEKECSVHKNVSSILKKNSRLIKMGHSAEKNVWATKLLMIFLLFGFNSTDFFFLILTTVPRCRKSIHGVPNDKHRTEFPRWSTMSCGGLLQLMHTEFVSPATFYSNLLLDFTRFTNFSSK